jgi:hypothetical protein
VFAKRDSTPDLPQNFLYVSLSVLYFSVRNAIRGEGENTGVNKEKELFAVMVNLSPQELRDTYLSTVLEQISVQV